MKTKSKSMRKKSIAILAGVAIAGAVGASAASLGGLGGEDLGADTGDVASCDTDGITVGYTTEYNATAGEYVVTDIDLSDINAACALQDFDLMVLMSEYDDALGEPQAPVAEAPIGPFTGVIGATGSQSISMGTTIVPAEHVSGLAMSISGATVVGP